MDSSDCQVFGPASMEGFCDNQLWKLENSVIPSKCGYIVDAGSGSAGTKVADQIINIMF